MHILLSPIFTIPKSRFPFALLHLLYSALLSSHLFLYLPPFPSVRSPLFSYFHDQITCILLMPSLLLTNPPSWQWSCFVFLFLRSLWALHSHVKVESQVPAVREQVMLAFPGLSDLTKSLNTIFSSYTHLPAVELPSVYTMFLLPICQLYGS